MGKKDQTTETARSYKLKQGWNTMRYLAYTIRNPRAVMVKLLYTTITSRTML
jgi:hypothetical protein